MFFFFTDDQIFLKVFFHYFFALLIPLSFGNILYDYVQKYNTLKTETLRKYEKLKIKIRKAELDLTFLTNCQTLNVYRKFLTFNLPNVISYNARFIRERLLRSAIKKRKKSYIHLEKMLLFMKKILKKFYLPLINIFWPMQLRKMFINVPLKPLRHMKKS